MEEQYRYFQLDTFYDIDNTRHCMLVVVNTSQETLYHGNRI